MEKYKHIDNYLTFNEKLIINDIINEDMKNIKTKLLSYLSKGVLTATILLTLLGGLNAQEKEEILNIVKQENPELYQEVSINGKWTSYKQEKTTKYNNTSSSETFDEKTSVNISENKGYFSIKIKYNNNSGSKIVIKDNSVMQWTVIHYGENIDLTFDDNVKDMSFKIIELTNNTLIFEVSMSIQGSTKTDRFFCKKEQLAQHLQL